MEKQQRYADRRGVKRLGALWAIACLGAPALRVAAAQEGTATAPTAGPVGASSAQVAPVTPGITMTQTAFALPPSAAPQAVAAAVSGEPQAFEDDDAEDKIGSTNVPMDSWIYPALERLGAMGLVPFQTESIRPWTRQECRRQVNEAEEILAGVHGHYYDVSDSIRDEAERLLPQLREELAEPHEAEHAVLEEAYAREGTIAGPALTDSFHFGQTWWNDFGRPLERGSSAIAGYEFRGVYKRLFFFDRQELQQSPTVPGVTAAQSALFYQLDDAPFTVPSNPPPIPVSGPTPAYVRQRPLELYAGYAFDGFSVSFGKQELFWGPTTMGPLSFSSNAEPTYNLRLVATRPHPFPIFPTLGTFRFDAVFGKLSGHHYPARPYFNGAKVDLTFGRTLEVSYTRWSILFGQGHPMTFENLGRNLFSINSTGCGFGYGDRCDPGDRKSDFDFRLHVPGLRNYLTVYADSYADDEPIPVDAPRRVVWSPGVYLPRLPGLPHMDFRAEMASSEELSQDEGGTRDFINNQYRDGNTNKGFLLGNAVGRDARALEGRTGYWFTGKTRVELGYRQTKGGHFLPGDSTISDGFLNASYAWSPEWTVEVFGQYERFLVPSYLPGPQHNLSGWVELRWNPKLSLVSK